MHIFQNKAFTDRSRTPATCKMEIFGKENNGGKPLIINIKFTILDLARGLYSVYIFTYIPIQYEIFVFLSC